MRTPLEDTGFNPPNSHPLGRESRTTTLAELTAIFALTIATLVVATVVSAGMAHAEVVDGIIGHEGRLYSVALLLGLIFIGIAGFPAPGRANRR